MACGSAPVAGSPKLAEGQPTTGIHQSSDRFWDSRRLLPTKSQYDAIRKTFKRLDQSMSNEWGPLSGLIGEWESDSGGLDTAFSHSKGEVLGSPYREKCTMKPFGPVDNGSQSLYGLDYKSAMWRWDEENPFHTEVGYWLWDAATGEVMKGFVVPRGIVVLAGGTAGTDATSFTLKASLDDPQYSIGENKYLAKNASSRSYVLNVTTNGDTWSYDEVTVLRMNEFDEPFSHTDHNTLRLVG